MWEMPYDSLFIVINHCFFNQKLFLVTLEIDNCVFLLPGTVANVTNMLSCSTSLLMWLLMVENTNTSLTLHFKKVYKSSNCWRHCEFSNVIIIMYCGPAKYWFLSVKSFVRLGALLLENSTSHMGLFRILSYNEKVIKSRNAVHD